MKHFHEENSIISGLFNLNNLVLCGTQGNNELLASRFSLLASAKLAGQAVSV